MSLPARFRTTARTIVDRPRDVDAIDTGYLLTQTVTALPRAIKHRADFADVRVYCMFIGHGRSGHSLVGSLLNAHAQATVSHELDALKYLRFPITRQQLFAMILRKDARFNSKGRKWGSYVYDIEGAHQGEFETLRVIGDNRGGKSTSRLGKNPELLERLRSVVTVPLRVIQVIRNPFDNIASAHKTWDITIDRAINYYFTNAEYVDDIASVLSDAELFRTRHEDFVYETRAEMESLCEYLSLEIDEQYLDTCEEFVFDSPKKTRHDAEWSDEQIQRVQNRITEHDWLDGYTFDSE